MSMMVSFVLSFFPRDVLGEILSLIGSVSGDFLTTLPFVWGWSGGAMVLGKLPVPGQGPIGLAVGAGVFFFFFFFFDIFTLLYPFSPLFSSLWETARYRLKYRLKGPLYPNQPTNQPFVLAWVLKLATIIWLSLLCLS